MAARRIVFLTGAPHAKALRWDEDELTAQLLPCFLDDKVPFPLQTFASIEPRPLWRFLPLERQHLPTGLTQASQGSGKNNDNLNDAWSSQQNSNVESSFLSISDLSFTSTAQANDVSETQDEKDVEALTQFYDHSYAVHEAVPSSQIVPVGSGASITTESSTQFSGGGTSDSCSLSNVLEQNIPTSGHLTDLADIPRASYLQSITPQTMTVNLIVGVISILPPRMIKIRRSGRLMELVEMLVGDETKAGFGINVWLPSSDGHHERATSGDIDMKTRISALRPQDIVLVRNVALSSFKGKVYGQSLRKEMTKFDILYRNMMTKGARIGAYDLQRPDEFSEDNPQKLKVRRVKEWVVRFVGGVLRPPQVESTSDCCESIKYIEWQGQSLPLDTQ